MIGVVGTTMCAQPECARDAEYEISAEGTSHGHRVCTDHFLYAKQQVVQDFPGRQVVRTDLFTDDYPHRPTNSPSGWPHHPPDTDDYSDADGW